MIKLPHILLTLLSTCILLLPVSLSAGAIRTAGGTVCQREVTLEVTPAAGISAWVYEERVQGLKPATISGNGVWLSYPGVIRWGIHSGDAPQVFSYSLSGSDGAYAVSGSESADGVDRDTDAATVTIDCASVNPPPAQVAAPLFDPPGGTDVPVSVAISTTTAGATIYYTTDGVIPDAASTPYTAPFVISDTTLLQAVAIRGGMAASPVVRAWYLKPAFFPAQSLSRSQAGTVCRPVVCIEVVPRTGTSAYVVEETLGPGLVPENSSHNGLWDANTSIIRWAIFLDDQPRTLTYELTGPDGSYALSGSGSFDGLDQGISGSGQTVIDCIPDQTAPPVIAPAGGRAPVTVSMTTTTENGEIRFTTDGSEPDGASTLYTGPVLIQAAATLKAKTFLSGLTPSETAQASYLPAQRPKAIIVAGGGPYAGNSLWPATSYVSAYAYKALLYQGYAKEDIRFLSHDTELDVDGNGVLDDVYALTGRESLQQAIATWASDASELLLFLTDHGGDKTFLLGPGAVLTAADLAGWLDTLQSTLQGRVIVIYDACQSGTFLASLTPPAGKERIVITSASNEPAVFLEGGVLSFSYQFWANIFSSGKLYDAYLTGSALMKDDQRSLLDANGNGIANEKADKLAVAGLTIGRGMVSAAAPPHINAYAGEQVITAGTSATVWVAEINSLDPLARVWAVIMPPNYHPGNAGTPITDLPTIDLTDENGDGRYEATYNGFTLNGAYRLVIYAKDNQGLISSPRKVDVIQTGGIIPNNTIPVAHALTIATDEDTPYQGMLSAGDADGDVLNYLIVDDGAIGTVSITNVTTGEFIYRPHANETGMDSFTYKVNDGTVDSTIATVTVTINPVEDVPKAADLAFATARNTPLNGTLVATDGDGDPLTLAIVAQPAHGLLNLSNPSTGAFSYTPENGYYGGDSFTFTASDGKALSAPGTVTITIDRGYNNPPAALDNTFTGEEDHAIQANLTGSDPDGDPLAFVLVTLPVHGSVTLTDARTGAFSYNPAANFNGADSFTFRVNDGLSDSVPAVCTITVSPVNDSPVALSGSLSVNSFSGASGQLRGTDIEGDPLTYAVATNGSLGRAVITDPTTGAFTYTPNGTENSIDTFTFTVSDGQAVSEPGQVSVSIHAHQADISRAISGDGCTEEMRLIVTPVASVQAYVIEETLPAGLVPTNINENGLWDSANRKIKWGLFADHGQRTFTYSVTGDDGAYDISGGGSFDGWDMEMPHDRVVLNCQAQRVAMPIFSPASGARVPVDVTIASDTADAEIRYTTDGSEPTESSLLYSTSIHLNEPATIRARAYKAGAYSSNLSEARYLPTTGDKAIIVIGGGPDGNSLWEATQLAGEYAYKALLYQGYAKEEIMLLSAGSNRDVDGNGVLDDVDGFAETSVLRDAVTNWAADAKSLLLFMTDHGGQFTFKLNPNDILAASDLDGWLDTLQASMNGKVIVVYDACRSGSFIGKLTPPSGKSRVIITSSSDESAWFLGNGKMSFSYQFWASIFGSASIYDAYTNAGNLMRRFQSAMVDADGDGIVGEHEDLLAIKDLLIGRGAVAAGTAPVIGSVSPSLVLSTGTSATFTVGNITSLNRIERVWAVIVPPVSSSASPDNPVTEMPEVDLVDPEGDGFYTATYSGFTDIGVYNISIFSVDSQGLYSAPVTTAVAKGTILPDSYETDDTYQQAKVILLNDQDPNTNIEGYEKYQEHNFHKAGDEDWVMFPALAGKTYKLSVNAPGPKSDPSIRIYGTDGVTPMTSEADDYGPGEGEYVEWTCLADGIYYARVKQGAGSEEIFGVDTQYQLTLTIPAAAFSGFIYGQITPAVSLAMVSTGYGSALTLPNGFFFMPHIAGNFTLTVTADGYDTYSGNVTVGELAVATVNVALTLTAPPSAPSTPTLEPVISPTKTTVQTIRGTKEANTSVWLNGVQIVALDALTTWSYSMSLSEGNNSISLTLKNGTGLQSPATTGAILLDTIAPAVSAGGNQTKNAQFTQTATATDASAMTYAWTKQTGPGVVTFGSSTARSTTISASGDGTYVLRFIATDAAGNSSYGEMTLVWSTVAPTLSIGAPSASITKGGPIVYTLTYTNADTVTLSNSNVSLVSTGTATGTASVTGTGNTTRTVTISGITGNGALGISIAAGTANNTAGNTAAAAGPSATFTVDNTEPVVNAGANQTKNAQFTQTATATDANAMTYAWTKQSGPGVITFGSPNALSTTISASVEGSYTVRFTATDAAGNSSYSDMMLTWDTSKPTVTVGAPSATVTKSGPVTYIVTYTGADSLTLSEANVTLIKTGTANCTVAVTGTGNTTRMVTISAITGDGTLGISIAAGTAIDSAGNLATSGGPSSAFTADNTAPAAAISAPSVTLTKSGPVTYTVTYTGADSVTLGPAGVTLNKSGTVNGTISITGTDNTTRTVTVSGIAGDGTLGISIAAGTASDSAGNQAVAAGPSSTITVDNTAPTVAIGAPSATLTKAGPVTYTVTYTGADTVTLAPANVTLIKTVTANGTVEVTGTGNTTRTVTVSNITGEGTLGISIAVGTASDSAGNQASAAGPSSAFTVDNTAPTVAIGAPSAALTNSGPVTYTVTYTGADTVALANSNVTLVKTGTANGTVAVTGTGNTTRTVTITGITGNGTLGISIASSTASDTVGNQAVAAGPSLTFTVDNAAPTVVIGSPSAALTKSGPVTYTVTYTSADSVTLSPANVTLIKTGTANGMVAVTGTGNMTRTVTVSNITGEGTLGISIASGTASDSAGNLAVASGPSSTFTVDNTAPTVAIGAPSVALTNSGPVTYTVTYTGADSVALANANVMLVKTGTANGTVSVTGTGNTTRTVTISGITGDGTLGISIAAGTASDSVGNQAAAAGPSSAFTVDNTAPTVVIGNPSATLTKSGPVIYTVSYTGADSVMLSNANVTLIKTGTANGTVTVTGTGNTTRTVTVSNITGDGTLGISIASGTASDSAGNLAVASGPSSAFTVDNTVPILAIGAPSAALTNSGPVTYTVTYTGADSVALANANVMLVKTGTANGTVSVSGTGNTTRTVTISGITGDGTLGISIAAGTASDSAGNQAAAAGPSSAFTVDNTAPTVVIGSPSAALTKSGPITYTVTYTSADSITLSPANVTFIKTGTANGSVTVSGTGNTTRMVTVSNITGDGTLGISIAAGTASDSAGNLASAAGASSAFTVDNTLPIVSAGTNQAKGIAFTQTGTASDASGLSYGWSQQSGPGTVNFGSPNAISTAISASANGVYVIRFTVTDAAGNISYSDMTLTWDVTVPSAIIGAPSFAVTNDGPVTYTVTYTGADTITLTDANVMLIKTGTANGTVSVTGTGNTTLTVTISTITGDGTLGILIAADTASNNAGNLASAVGPSATFMVDNMAPSVSAGDNQTKGTSFTQTGTANDSSVMNYVWTKQSGPGTVTFGSSTALSTTISASEDGTYVLRFTATDAAGNSSYSEMTLVWSTVAPTLIIGAPSALVTKGGPITYTVTYANADTVTLSNDNVTLVPTGTATGTVSVTGTGNTTRTVTISGITGNGALGISIAAGTASNTAGNTAEAAGPSTTFTVDNTAPVVDAGGNQTKNAQFTQTATATDANTMTYAWSKQSGPGVIAFGSPNALSTTISASVEGSYTMRFTATDAAGNSSYSDMTLTWDTSKPTVTVGAPSVTLTKSGPVTYTVTYTGADSITLAPSNVTLMKSGTANGTIAVTGTGSATRTLTISGITGDGTLGISIAAGTASDSAGNQAVAAGPSSTITVDNTAPTVSAGTNQTKGSAFTQTGTATDTSGLTYSWSQVSGPGMVNFGSANEISTAISASANGVYVIRFTVTDVAGNISYSDMTLTWDATAPSPIIGGPSAAMTKSGPVTYIVTYTGADSVALTDADVTLVKTGTADGAVVVSGEGSTTRTVTISNITGDGTLGISIAADTASDNAGNLASAAGPSATFTVDNTAQVVSAGDNQTKGTSFTQTGTANDSSVMNYAWTKQSGPGTVIFGTADALSTTISATQDGTYTIRLTVTDAAGNSSFSDMTLVWDATAPVTTANPAGGTFGVPQTVTLNVNEAATVYYTTDGSGPTESSSIYSVPIAIPATATLKYFAKDLAGNTEPVKTQTYVIDKKLNGIQGDINGDGFVSLSDAIIAMQIMANMQPSSLRSDYALSNADVNDDGKVGPFEVIYILQKVVQLR